MSAIIGKAEDDHATATDQTDNGGQNVQVDSALPAFPHALHLCQPWFATLPSKGAHYYVQVRRREPSPARVSGQACAH